MKTENQAAAERKCEEARKKGYMSGEDVEKAWNKDIVGAANMVCGIA